MFNVWSVQRFVTIWLLSLAWMAVATPAPPTKTYERAMLAALEAEEELLLCRAMNSSERLREIACFEQANRRHPYNATWWKQLGALYEMSAMPAMAAEAYNTSAYTILEAQGFVGPLAKTDGLSRVTMLKLYRRREPEGSYEVAKAWLMAMVLHHQLTQARTILTDFMDLLYPDDRTVQYRAIGAIWDVAKFRAIGLNGASRCRLCFFAEEIPFAIELWSQRMLSAPLTTTAVDRNEMLNYTMTFCGRRLPYDVTYLARDVMSFLMLCAGRQGDFDRTIQEDGAEAITKGYLALDRSVSHHLAALGADRPLRAIAQKFPVILTRRDNFGRTPLHYAAAHRQAHTFALLARLGADPKLRDAGGVTPTEIACFSMRDEFLAVSPRGICDGTSPISERIQEDEDEDCDRSGGGFDVKSPVQSCSLDIRTADGISHETLVAEFLLNSRPVVLRGGVPRKVQDMLRRSSLNKLEVWLRKELFPNSERFGTMPMSRNMTITEIFMNVSERFGVVEVPSKHPLFRRVRHVPRCVVKPKGDDPGYTTTKESYPLFIFAGEGARTNHVFADSHTAHFVAHGAQQWVLHPPTTAFSSSGQVMLNVSQGATAERCVLLAGDALIIPSLWSRAWASLGESLSFKRRFYWR